MEKLSKLAMLEKLCEMQQLLDESVYTQHNSSYNEEKCYIALMDEIGELTHEIKSKWCWWKTQCPPIDKQKVLEELVDCWHFALSIYNHEKNSSPLSDEIKAFMIHKNKPRAYKKLIQIIMSDYQKFILGLMIELSATLDFTLADVYAAYIKKNKVNYERLKNGY